MNRILFFVLSLILTGCVGKGELEEKNKRIEQLEKELSECRQELNGYKRSPSKLLKWFQYGIEREDEDYLLSVYDSLKQYHPESNEKLQADKLLEQYNNLRRKKKEERRLAEEKAEKEKFASLNRLKKDHDDVEGQTWYKNPYFIHYTNSNLTSIYIGKKDDTVWLRLKMSYYGDDWIFFDTAYLSYDGNTIEIPFDEYRDKKTDHEADVWEWIDVSVSDSMLSFLRQMVNSSSPKMRLSGKYSKTRTLSKNEIKGIKDVIAGYDVLKSNINQK